MHKIFLHSLLLSFTTLCCYSLPLSTSSRWILDEPTGARVKLACVNWAAHLEPMLAEGLDKKPLADIATRISHMGFNCVRLTWATHMLTRHSNLTVAQSFRNLGLQDSAGGIALNNPRFLNLTLVEAQRAVVEELARRGVMVVLDNHVSQPSWCCGDHDGNGFFGDKYFDPTEWLRGLAMVAELYENISMVVGMSLRNELRGPLQNTSDWHLYVEAGARTINEANPRLLVIVSGLHYDLGFAFLNENYPLQINFKNKLVYEIHRYVFTAGQRKVWLSQPFTKACENITQEIHRQAGFLVEGENGAPLFVSEFGIRQVEVDRADSFFMGCFLGYLAEMDLDWGIWALQGSYYLRSGLRGLDETYGLLDSSWASIRNPDFHKKLQLIQQQIKGPNPTGSTYRILYHPSSGQCARVDESEVHARDCWSFSRWNYKGHGNPIQLEGTEMCLAAGGDGMPVTLSRNCGSIQSQWETISSSDFQVANKDEHGKYVCLDWDPGYSTRVFTKSCVCLEADDSVNCRDSPRESQWFKLISANVQ